MNCAWLFLSSLLCLAIVYVNGLGIDDLDFARWTLESAAKSITAKAPKISGARAKNIKMSYGLKSFKGWATSARITTSSVAPGGKVARTKSVKTTKPRNLNKFNEVMDQVERAMAQAELARKTANLIDLKTDITNAVNLGNVRFARRALGIALYTARANEKKSRGKRSAGIDAKKFLDDVKNDLGDEKFSDFLALQGEVTLMFALDVTGSMREEIASSKNIIEQISKEDRSEPVDFVLNTFSDPLELGKTKYYPEDQVDVLIKDLGAIKVVNGGDCPEYSFDGMINALYEDPRWGSPLYVFTDAVPKDADEESKETLRVLADDLGVTVNFFAGKTVCTTGGGTEQDFKDIVEEYGGQYLKIDDKELKGMGGYTSSSLEGTSTAVSGKSKTARRKRRATSNIAIPVDDTVTRLVVTVTTESSPHGIQLYTATGSIQTAGKTVLSRVIVFTVDNPSRGLWKLVVPSSVGKYEYTAKVISPENIDFEHYYNKIEQRKVVPYIRNPLAGENAQVSVTVSGASKIQKATLLVDIIDISGNTLLANKKLTEVGKSGIRFTFQFTPPNKAFKLMLKGKTTSGKNFQRISRHVDSSKPLVIKEFYSSRYYTIPQKGSTFIILYLYNGLNTTKYYQISFKTKKGYTASFTGSRTRRVRGGRKGYVRVSVKYNGGTPGKKGETLNVVVIVKGTDNSFITTEVVPLMII